MRRDEGVVLQNVLNDRADALAPLGAGIVRQDAVSCGGELFERIRHSISPQRTKLVRALPSPDPSSVTRGVNRSRTAPINRRQ
jgi:hypothetical protein